MKSADAYYPISVEILEFDIILSQSDVDSSKVASNCLVDLALVVIMAKT